ncbi:MAG: hypothetical protein WCP39_03670 [Chlamydiota bacterium]
MFFTIGLDIMFSYLKEKCKNIRKKFFVEEINENLGLITYHHLLDQGNYAKDHRLESFGKKFFSQNEEDGILEEICRRAPPQSKTFLELGVEDGAENNTLCLLLQGWQGTWMEGSPKHCQKIKKTFSSFLENKKLQLIHSYITKDNILTSLQCAKTPPEIGLLSIDLDGNDYHILETILSVYTPQIIVTEYNAHFPPPIQWIMKYDQSYQWNGKEETGASLQSLVQLLRKKQYSLIGCNITGTNAFFIRSEKVQDKFWEADNILSLYQPLRYYLTTSVFRKKRSFSNIGNCHYLT